MSVRLRDECDHTSSSTVDSSREKSAKKLLFLHFSCRRRQQKIRTLPVREMEEPPVQSALQFELLATDGRARATRIKLRHHDCLTPMFMPVGTQGTFDFGLAFLIFPNFLVDA